MRKKPVSLGGPLMSYSEVESYWDGNSLAGKVEG